ncbi:AbgT family transporter [Deferribacterales bacterium RsTz2092]|nr:aminobenzoyl-glutamate transporter [Deferribacterales bacterium]
MSEKSSNSVLYRVLNMVEVAGNRLPDPISIFFILCLLLLAISYVFEGVVAIHPKDGSTITVINLISKAQLQNYLNSIVTNFSGFPPLALVLIVQLGVGVADRTGLMATALRRAVSNMPKSLVTFIVIFAGINANAAGDSGFIVLPPLAAIAYMASGRHPLIGVLAGFGGVAAGFAANLFPNMLDILVWSFTLPAAQTIDPSYTVLPTMNFYFLFVSTFFLTAVGVIVTEKVIAPRFEGVPFQTPVEHQNTDLSVAEKKGLRWAGISLLAFIAVLVLLCLGDHPFMGDSKTGELLGMNAPMNKAMTTVMLLLFFIPGVTYGICTGKIKNDRDIVKLMGQSMSDMGSYIVLAFAASQFLALFNFSHLGVIIAIKGAEVLKNANMTGMGLMVGFILFSAFLNLFIGSCSAKWAILAPVFVPMFLLLNFDPPLTQIAYRIGDSVSNPLSPLFPYFPILLGYVAKYKPDAGIGTIISNMLPFSLANLVAWIILIVVFMAFNIPLGIY